MYFAFGIKHKHNGSIVEVEKNAFIKIDWSPNVANFVSFLSRKGSMLSFSRKTIFLFLRVSDRIDIKSIKQITISTCFRRKRKQKAIQRDK